jgi:hypothetical protein
MHLIEVLRFRRYLYRDQLAVLSLHRHGTGLLIHCGDRDYRFGHLRHNGARRIFGVGAHRGDAKAYRRKN